MAAAWAVSVCYVKFPEKTEVFLRKNLLDDFTHNKAIQKIRESYRVSKEDKERLKELRREECPMKAEVNDKIRIINKMNDWSMEYQEGDIFTVESTWYGGVNVTSKTGVPISLDEVEYEVMKTEDSSGVSGKKRKGPAPCRYEKGTYTSIESRSRAVLCMGTGRPAGKDSDPGRGSGSLWLQGQEEIGEKIKELKEKEVVSCLQKVYGRVRYRRTGTARSAETVPWGISELLQKQAEGYLYIKF